jgi:hypothetical protein
MAAPSMLPRLRARFAETSAPDLRHCRDAGFASTTLLYPSTIRPVSHLFDEASRASGKTSSKRPQLP